VSLQTAQGQAIQASAVVACDGLRSRLRAQMRPDDVPRESGYVAHRSLIPMDQAPAQVQQRQSVTMWAGPGLHVIYYPLRQASLLNIVLVVRMPAHLSSTQDQGYQEYLQDLLAQAQPEAQQVANETTTYSAYRLLHDCGGSFLGILPDSWNHQSSHGTYRGGKAVP
jgi:salicylate hydroxylase